jgi:hypothetical protein
VIVLTPTPQPAETPPVDPAPTEPAPAGKQSVAPTATPGPSVIDYIFFAPSAEIETVPLPAASAGAGAGLYAKPLSRGLGIGILVAVILYLAFWLGSPAGGLAKPITWLAERLVAREDRGAEEYWDLVILRLLFLVYGAALVWFVAARMLTEGWTSRVAEPGALYWLWFPAVFMLGSWLSTWLLYPVSFWYSPGWTSGFRSAIGTYKAFSFGAMLVAVLFAVLAVPHYFARPDVSLSVSGIVAVISFLWASNLANRMKNVELANIGATGKKLFQLRPWMQRALLATLVAVLLLSVLIFFELLFEIYAPAWTAAWSGQPVVTSGMPAVLLLFFVSLAVWIYLSLLVDWNKISPHYFYRDRLADTFLKTEVVNSLHEVNLVRDNSEARLAELNPYSSTAPYHLIVTALNLQGSRDLAHKDRQADHFIFSRCYCGSHTTGYVCTASYRGGKTKLARAMTISGAAASTAMGGITFFAQAFMMTILNARLGYWLENPRNSDDRPDEGYVAQVRNKQWTNRAKRQISNGLANLPWVGEKFFGRAEKRTFWLQYLWDQLRGQPSARRSLVDLSDGAHTGDNNGLYPLLQRRCKIIVVGDAGCDPEFRFEDLSRVIRWAYLNDHINIHINPESLRPDEKTRFSQTHFVVGRIDYPDTAEPGYLLYFKPAMADDSEEISLRRYWRQHCQGDDQFPHQTTGDQYYDEDQFEAYRRLGEISVRQAFKKFAAELKQTGTEPGFDNLTKFLGQAYTATVAKKEGDPKDSGQKRGWFWGLLSGRQKSIGA